MAEAAKILENIQRDVNIALMNECSELFARLGIDTTEVLRTAATKWNFGHYRPGLVGGHCIGVDPYYLLARAEEAGVELPVMRASRTINERTSGRIARELTQALLAQGKHPSGSRVLLLGMTYKADVADCRNTKSADLFRALERAGFRIQAADPYADAQEVCDTYGIELTEELQPPYDLVVVAVGHPLPGVRRGLVPHPADAGRHRRRPGGDIPRKIPFAPLLESLTAGPQTVCRRPGRRGQTRLMSRAGTPPTTVFGSTSFDTTAPAATIAFSPTVTPGRMVAPAPIQQLRFRCTDLQISASWSS